MPLLLLVPLLVLALLALWVLLLPFLLWARYRNGRARRRVQGWVVRVNAWLLAASVPLLLGSAWISSHWLADALPETGAGLLLGVLLGIVSLWLTRFEPDASGFHYTPNRWLVLGLTALVAARIVAGLVVGWQRIDGAQAAPIALLDGAGLLAIAGVFLGYALAYTWGLRARLPPRAARAPRLPALLFAALLLLLPATTAAAEARLAGGWRGEWIKGGQALPVTVSFVREAQGGYTGSFDSDALQVAGIPLAQISEHEGAVRWLLKGDRSTIAFDGRLAGDELSGTLAEGAAGGSFKLVRATLPAALVVARDVQFVNGDIRLAGTLLLPKAPGRHAAVLFLHGSGPEGRWANRWLAQKFAEQGMVALIYDKRGVGESGGHWETSGFEALAEDARAGVTLLRAQAEVDPARIGLYGHSQGGSIAPIVAARDAQLAFVIASGTSGLATAPVEVYSLENSMGVARLPPEERKQARAYARALVDVAYRGGPRAPLDALAATLKDRPWYFEPPPPGHSYWSLSRQIAGFDPAQWWRQVHAPVLLVYGAHDERVPVAASAAAIRAALKAGGNRQVTVKIYADADHTFTIVGRDSDKGWPLHEPDYADTLAAWAQAATAR